MPAKLDPTNRHQLPFSSGLNLQRACLLAGLCLALVALLGACSPSTGLSAPVSAARPLLAVAPPGSTATATPFQPLPPTPTYLPTEFFLPASTQVPFTPQAVAVTSGQSKNWSDYPGPIIWPDIQIPPPAGLLPQPEGQINILLLGSDQRPYEGGFRTDTIVLLTINPAAGTANLTSFPRDLYVYIPGWTVERINTAFAYGGFDSLALTFEYNFGVHPDYYVLINLWSFEDMVDSLDGLLVEVSRDLCDHRDGWGQYCVTAGTRLMDGETALWYVRSRYSTSDFDRGRRQQEVILAGFHRLISMDGVRRAPELYEIYRENVITDMSFEDISPFLPYAAHMGEASEFQHFFIGPQQVTSWVNYSGAQVLIPIQEAALEVMRQALNSP